MSETNGLLQDKHIHCINIIIKKQTSSYMQTVLLKTRNITNKHGVMKPKTANAEEGHQFRPSDANVMTFESMRSWTLCFRILQSSVECPSVPEWYSHLAFTS